MSVGDMLRADAITHAKQVRLASAAVRAEASATRARVCETVATTRNWRQVVLLHAVRKRFATGAAERAPRPSIE